MPSRSPTQAVPGKTLRTRGACSVVVLNQSFITGQDSPHAQQRWGSGGWWGGMVGGLGGRTYFDRADSTKWAKDFRGIPGGFPLSHHSTWTLTSSLHLGRLRVAGHRLLLVTASVQSHPSRGTEAFPAAMSSHNCMRRANCRRAESPHRTGQVSQLVGSVGKRNRCRKFTLLPCAGASATYEAILPQMRASSNPPVAHSLLQRGRCGRSHAGRSIG